MGEYDNPDYRIYKFLINEPMRFEHRLRTYISQAITNDMDNATKNALEQLSGALSALSYSLLAPDSD